MTKYDAGSRHLSLGRTGLLLGAALSVLASPAWAQTPIPPADDASAAAGDDAIVVTGRLGTTNVMEIPMAIQEIPVERIADLHVTSVSDLSLVAPSFRVARSYQGTPNYSIRGIGFNAVNMSASPTVGFYQDDIAYPYPFTQLGPIFDVGGIQVLKGPQGTVFGRNTTAGVINVQSNQPTENFEGSLAMDVGNYDTVNAEGYLSGRIGPWLKGRIAFRTEHSFEGWQRSKSRPNEKLGEIHNTGFRVILDADPAPGLDINLSVSGWRNDSDTRAMQAIGLTPGTDSFFNQNSNTASATNYQIRDYLHLKYGVYTRTPLPWKGRYADWAPLQPGTGDYSTAPGRGIDVGRGTGMPGNLEENTSFWSASLNVGYDISADLHLVSLSNFQKLSRNSLQDASGAPFEILVQNPTGSIKSWSQELRLEGESGPVKWAIGGYYGHDKIRENIRSLITNNSNSEAIRSYFIFGAYLSPEPYSAWSLAIPEDEKAGLFRTLSDTADYRVDTKSLLANADWAITDTLNLAVGARYTWDKLDFNGCTRDFNGNTIQGVNSVVAYLISKSEIGSYLPTELAAPGQCVTMNIVDDPTAANPEKQRFARGPVINKLNEDNFSWRAALNWRPIDELMLYASASRGYKSGVNPLNTANSFRQDEPVKQEKLTAYEAGMRTDFGRAKFSLGGFYYDYRNKQLSGYYKDPVFTTLARLVNVPKSRAWGVEGDLSVEPVDGLTLFGSALYLDTKIQNYLGLNELGNDADYAGSTFGNPKWALSGGTSFDTRLGDDLGLRATINYSWQSKQKGMRSTQLAHEGYDIFTDRYGILPAAPSPLENFYDIGAYGVLNGNITLFAADKKAWEVSVWGRNLTQENYAVAVRSNATTIFRIPGDPRTFGATFRLNF
ncbi:TonB-dependent receptor [Sphingopyxis sp. LARHCG72]